MNALKYQSLLILALSAGSLVAGEQEGLPSKLFRSVFGVRVSRETTHITEPLADDGYIDYFAALNDLARKGVTIDNNAAALLWQALGPGRSSKDFFTSDDFREFLGSPPAEKGDYFIEYVNYLKETSLELFTPTDENKDPESKFSNRQRKSMSRPWSKKDFPRLATWLKRNEIPLQLTARASRRPRYYSPFISFSPEKRGASFCLDEGLYYDRLPWQVRNLLAPALLSRAMMFADEGRFEECWNDIMTAHRLARLIAQCANFAGAGYGIEELAHSATINLVRRVPLTNDQLATMRSDRERLPPFPSLIEKIDVAMRYEYLDIVSRMPRKNLGLFLYLNPDFEMKPVMWYSGQILRWTTDWDAVMREGNEYFDKQMEIAKIPFRWQRHHASQEMRRALSQKWVRVRTRLQLIERHPALLVLKFRKYATDVTSVGMLDFMSSAPIGHTWSRDTAQQQAHLADIFIALVWFKRTQRRYPKSLDDLTPKYLTAIPLDPFSAAGFRYQQREKGFLLYSVGRNGKDEGGRAVNEAGIWRSRDPDDVAIRIPEE